MFKVKARSNSPPAVSTQKAFLLTLSQRKNDEECWRNGWYRGRLYLREEEGWRNGWYGGRL